MSENLPISRSQLKWALNRLVRLGGEDGSFRNFINGVIKQGYEVEYSISVSRRPTKPIKLRLHDLDKKFLKSMKITVD